MKDKSKHDNPKEMAHQPHGGEGNKTTARQYNEAQRQFARGDEVDEQGHAAEKALDSPERIELEHAELVGERHVAEKDPTAKKH
jgi:hypothetical protein